MHIKLCGWSSVSVLLLRAVLARQITYGCQMGLLCDNLRHVSDFNIIMYEIALCGYENFSLLC